jgi:hypothetical protein
MEKASLKAASKIDEERVAESSKITRLRTLRLAKEAADRNTAACNTATKRAARRSAATRQ